MNPCLRMYQGSALPGRNGAPVQRSKRRRWCRYDPYKVARLRDFRFCRLMSRRIGVRFPDCSYKARKGPHGPLGVLRTCGPKHCASNLQKGWVRLCKTRRVLQPFGPFICSGKLHWFGGYGRSFEFSEQFVLVCFCIKHYVFPV